MQYIWTIPGDDSVRAYVCGRLFSHMAIAAHYLSRKVCDLPQHLDISHLMYRA